jgi:hypothetical protein
MQTQSEKKSHGIWIRLECLLLVLVFEATQEVAYYTLYHYTIVTLVIANTDWRLSTDSVSCWIWACVLEEAGYLS